MPTCSWALASEQAWPWTQTDLGWNLSFTVNQLGDQAVLLTFSEPRCAHLHHSTNDILWQLP